jgi:hypothetical protein
LGNIGLTTGAFGAAALNCPNIPMVADAFCPPVVDRSLSCLNILLVGAPGAVTTILPLAPSNKAFARCGTRPKATMKQILNILPIVLSTSLNFFALSSFFLNISTIPIKRFNGAFL